MSIRRIFSGNRSNPQLESDLESEFSFFPEILDESLDDFYTDSSRELLIEESDEELVPNLMSQREPRLATNPFGREETIRLVSNQKDEKYHHRQFGYYKELLFSEFCSDFRVKIDFTALYHPGIDGQPIRATGPATFWRAIDRFYNEADNRRIDTIFESLYTHLLYISSDHYTPAVVDLMPALALHSFYRGNDSRLLTLAFYLRDVGYDLPELFWLVTLVAAENGQTLLSEYFQALAEHNSGRFPYAGVAYDFISEKHLSHLSLGAGAGPDEERLWCNWQRTAGYGDFKGEQKVIRNLIEQGREADLNWQLNFYYALLSRGYFYKAIRFLKKHVKHHSADYLILRLYLENQKFVLFLNRLTGLKKIEHPSIWYEMVYALYSSVAPQQIPHLVERFEKVIASAAIPAPEQKKAYRKLYEESGYDEINTLLKSDEYRELLAAIFQLENRRGQLSGEDDKMSYLSFVNRQLESGFNSLLTRFGYELLLPTLLWSVTMPSIKIKPESLKFLQSLSYRIVNLRLLLGIYLFQCDRFEEAAPLLLKSPEHPLKHYYLYEIFTIHGDVLNASQSLKMLGRYENVAEIVGERSTPIGDCPTWPDEDEEVMTGLAE